MLFRLVGALAALVLTSAASAESYAGVAFAGAAAGEGLSGYSGIVRALPGNELGEGLAFRGAVSAGTYEYETGGTAIDGRFVAAETALVYQLSGTWGWANVSAGPRLSDVKLSPNDPSNHRRGTRVDLAIQSDGTLLLDSSWRLGWLGSLGMRDGAYFSRADLARVIAPESQTRLGVEAGLQGDPRYRSTNLGLFAATKLASRFEGRISAGASDREGRRPRPYATLGVSLLF